MLVLLLYNPRSFAWHSEVMLSSLKAVLKCVHYYSQRLVHLTPRRLPYNKSTTVSELFSGCSREL